MRKKFWFLLFFFVPFIINAEELKLEWQKKYSGNNIDYFNDFITGEDNMVAIGYTTSTDIDSIETLGGKEAIIVNYDEEGNIIWQKNYGGSKDDSFKNVIIDHEKNIIVSGHSVSTDIEGLTNKGGQDAIIVKYDKNGNLMWQKSFGGSKEESFSNMFVTNDNDIIVLGYTYSTNIDGIDNKGGREAIIIKYDKEGNIIWQKSFGGSGKDNFNDFKLTDNGEIIAYGYSNSSDIEGLTNKGGQDAIIVKYDENGNLLWQTNYGGSDTEDFNKIVLTSAKEIIVVGNSLSNDIDGITNKGGQDAIIVKYDENGNLLWQKSYGGNLDDSFNKIATIENEKIIVIGSVMSTDIDGMVNQGNQDAIIVKYDENGNLLWQKSYGGDNSDSFSKIIIDDDQYIIVGGTTNSTNIDGINPYGNKDIILVKYNSDGNLIWQKNHGESSSDVFCDFIKLNNKYLIMYGTTSNGNQDAMIIKYSMEYALDNKTTENGTATIEQKGSLGIITSNPNEGYKVEKVIIKDKEGNVLDVEVTEQEDGTLTFPLYTDVSVEVIYALAIDNPKTGILDVMTILIIGFLISITGIFIVKNYNERLEF